MRKEETTALVPVNGGDEPLHVRFSPLTAEKIPRGKHLLYCVRVVSCSLFCLFFLAVLSVLALSSAAGTDWYAVIVRLAESAYLGTAVLTVTDDLPQADTVDFPKAEPPAADTEEITEEDEELPPAAPPVQDADVYPIRQADLSCGTNVHALFNETDYKPDTAALLAAPLPFTDFPAWSSGYAPDDPYILIVHTHGTEAYAAEGALSYSTKDTFRSQDISENVVAAGAVMAETFRRAGIPVIHCTEMFDAESYQASYNRSAAAIRTYLEKYPSIQLVLDVHRDSVIRADLTKMQPVTEIGGEEYAQFMIVAGTDAGGANFPYWQDNLGFALKIQSALMQKSDSLVRSVNLRRAAFNQQHAPASLLLEVGSCGNTLAQAKRTAALAAAAIIEVIGG